MSKINCVNCKQDYESDNETVVCSEIVDGVIITDFITPCCHRVVCSRRLENNPELVFRIED